MQQDNELPQLGTWIRVRTNTAPGSPTFLGYVVERHDKPAWVKAVNSHGAVQAMPWEIVDNLAMLTTLEAAAILNISRSRILKLIAADRLPAQKFGRDWLIAPASLDLVKVRKPGRPTNPR